MLLELATKGRETVVKDHKLKRFCYVRTIGSKLHYCFLAVESVSGRDEPITVCDWVPERARWLWLAPLGIARRVPQELSVFFPYT